MEANDRNFMSKKAIFLFLVALFIRMVVVNIWPIPKLIYIPIELVLLASALYLERKRIRDFFLTKASIRSDLILGLFLGIIYCLLDWVQTGLTSDAFSVLRWDTLALVPVGILLAGWRAGVYEELLFRSLAMGYLQRLTKNPYLAVIGQALLFWAAHTRYFNIESHYGIYVGIMGLVLGWITYKRKSIIPAMVIHSMVNSYAGAVLPPAEYIMKALMSWLSAH